MIDPPGIELPHDHPVSLNYNVTRDALWVMTFAEMAASRNGRSLAKPVDLLLGLMLVSDPTFSSELPCLGGVLLRASCAAPDDLPTLHDMGWSELPDEPSFHGRLTPGVTAVFDDATRLSRSLGADYIGPEHLLVSLVAESFDNDVDAWLTDAELTEAGVLRNWVALLLSAEPSRSVDEKELDIGSDDWREARTPGAGRCLE